MKTLLSKIKKNFKLYMIPLLFCVLITVSNGLNEYRSVNFPINFDRPIGVQIFSEMIGEVRTILASYIFLLTDHYHHEREERVRWDEDAVTLPLHRLVTALDPKFEQAYDFGAYQLGVNLKNHREAIKFLLEGLRYNPDSYILHFTMGDIFYFRREFESALRYHIRAWELAEDNTEKANALRRIHWEYRHLQNYEYARRALDLLKVYTTVNDPTVEKLKLELSQLESGEAKEEDFRGGRFHDVEDDLRDLHDCDHQDTNIPDVFRQHDHHHHHH